jgi:flagellar hook-basal body complex protein FliE
MLPIRNAALLREVLLESRGRITSSSSSVQSESSVFTDILHAAKTQIEATETRAQHAVVGLLSGQGVEVHEATIATQQADLIFQLALQVRNKAVSAYQQMMQMQF